MHWKGQSLICPDLPAGQGLYIEHDHGFDTASFYDFKIDRCNPAVGNCKTETEIDEKIRQIEVDTFQLYSMMDYQDMTDKPLYKV